MTTSDPDTIFDDELNHGFMAQTGRLLLPGMLLGLGIGLLLAGAFLFYLEFIDKSDGGFLTGLICAVLIAIGAVIAVYSFLKWPTLRAGDPDTPRTRRLSRITFVLLAVSVGISVLFVSFGEGKTGDQNLFSNGPVPLALAISAALAWLIAIPIMGFYQRKNVDEVELEAVRFADTITLQAFVVLAPAWWMGWRGGVLPQPDVMIIFVVLVVVQVGANLWKRAR